MNKNEDLDWSGTQESFKAWMTVRDADLLEQFLLRVFKKNQEKLQIVEWGGGRSTCWYTHILEFFKVPYSWLMLEYNREFFDSEIKDTISERQGAQVFYSEDVPDDFSEIVQNNVGPISVVFNHGALAPFDTGIEAERHVNMDEYVDLPRKFNLESNIIIVDGRKRRRCLLEAQSLVRDEGYVLLHDAWRKHYQCAWDAFKSHSSVGDELWIGSNRETTFEDVMPWYAFGRHQDGTEWSQQKMG